MKLMPVLRLLPTQRFFARAWVRSKIPITFTRRYAVPFMAVKATFHSTISIRGQQPNEMSQIQRNNYYDWHWVRSFTVKTSSTGDSKLTMTSQFPQKSYRTPRFEAPE